jgi:cell division protein FtsI/penicillin-binding protein 2
MKDQIIFSKITRVLQVIGAILFLIIAKVWHLSVIQIDEKKIEAKRPQIRTILKSSNRGPIYDRYNIPLAVNRIKYRACIYYAHLKQFPSVSFKKDENGKRTRKTFRLYAHF